MGRLSESKSLAQFSLGSEYSMRRASGGGVWRSISFADGGVLSFDIVLFLA